MHDKAISRPDLNEPTTHVSRRLFRRPWNLAYKGICPVQIVKLPASCMLSSIEMEAFESR